MKPKLSPAMERAMKRADWIEAEKENTWCMAGQFYATLSTMKALYERGLVERWSRVRHFPTRSRRVELFYWRKAETQKRG